jgi:HTH-type transcriptional regulator, sugar sensing transcriptional regulator
MMTEIDRSEAVESLSRLGLSGYEAQVFVALQRTESATARDVARITEVPRSQVYSAAEGLEAQGLIDVQHSSPLRYRAVELEEARTHLQGRLAHEADRAFGYLEDIRHEFDGATETRADVWTVTGRETVTARLDRLIGEATDRVVFSTRRFPLIEGLIDTIEAAGAAGIDVTVVSANETITTRFEESPEVRVRPIPSRSGPEVDAGRVLVVDGETVLLSVLGEEELPGVRREAAIWSTRSDFAAVLAGLVDSWFERATER